MSIQELGEGFVLLQKALRPNLADQQLMADVQRILLFGSFKEHVAETLGRQRG